MKKAGLEPCFFCAYSSNFKSREATLCSREFAGFCPCLWKGDGFPLPNSVIVDLNFEE